MIRGTLVSTKTRCRQCLRWEGREDAENAGKGRKANPGTAESGDDAEGGAGKVRSRARRHSQNRGRERSLLDDWDETRIELLERARRWQ